MKKILSLITAVLLALTAFASCSKKNDKLVVAVPNDATNEARALLLLEKQGYIKLKEGAGITATVRDIVENPYNLSFKEVEAAQLPNFLKDVDYAVINSNYAISAKLNPVKDSLAIEGSYSAYGNILAVKEGNENTDKIKALKAALESKKVADFIASKYDGAVVSTVENPGDGFDSSVDYDALKGQTVKAKIIEVNEGKKRAVASIRRVKSEERKEKEAAFWANIEVGKQYDGVVRSLTAYGAFVDLGGVDGMVHSSELSWTRIRKPSDVVSVGETIHVYVKDFNPETKRISLGYKTEETNPWKIFTDRYGVGDVAEVKIVSLMPFGAFAEIVPGVDGLIHISQITDHKIGSPAEVLEVGQTVNAEIVGIDNDTHQVSLSVRALMEKDEGEY